MRWSKIVEKFNAFVGLSGQEGIDQEASESDLLDYLDEKLNNQNIKSMSEEQKKTATPAADVDKDGAAKLSVDAFNTALAELKGSISAMVTASKSNFEKINDNLQELNAKVDGNSKAIEDFKVEVEASNKALADDLIKEIPKGSGAGVQDDLKSAWNQDLGDSIEEFSVNTDKK